MEKIRNYVAIDLETTGLDPRVDSIIEIGAVRIEEGKETAYFQTFVKSGKKISERVTELTGIRNEDLTEGMEQEEAIRAILEFVGELPILGHSVLFDYSFIKKAAVNRKMTFETKGIDTLKLARKYLPELPSKRLEALCGHYQITYRAHRALEDARATVKLYRKLEEQFYEEAVFQPVPLFKKVKRETPATAHQKERLYELIEKHKLAVDYDVEQLTRNQASRYADKILAEHGRC